MNQADDTASGIATGQGGRPHCMNGELAHLLVGRLENHGLDARLVTYRGEDGYDERVEEIVIVNPAARERGEVRVGDDGSITWEYAGSVDEAGISAIVGEVTNALQVTSVRVPRDHRP
jgi:hypothetical protein